MANILVLDWLAENALRAFPLKHNTNKEADTGYVVANGLLLDLQLYYSTATSGVRLLSIVKSSGSAVFNFTGGISFTVNLPLTDKYHRAGKNLLVVGSVVANIPNGTHTFGQAEVDPHCIVKLYGKWLGVSSIKFGDGAVLTGNIELLEGLQAKVICKGNLLSIGASNLYGQSVGCTTFSTQPTDCDEIVSNISGIIPDGNNVYYLTAGEGMVVYDDPENHCIYVGFSFTEPSDVCKAILPNPVI